jgi:riboflavin synthase alpha subunit
MFTGIIQALGIILVASETAAGKRLTVSLAELADAPISAGDSVCVSGVCLTVVKVANGSAHFDVVTETLRLSTLGAKIPQDRVNLELSLRGDSFVGGHFVQGHVDGVARVVAVSHDPRDWRISFEAPASCVPYIVPKGSVAVDGVSMTIAEVSGDRFTLAVIPTTLEKTTLSGLRAGDQVNLETDILARTVVHYLQLMQRPGPPLAKPGISAVGHEATGGISMAKIRELGLA